MDFRINLNRVDCFFNFQPPQLAGRTDITIVEGERVNTNAGIIVCDKDYDYPSTTVVTPLPKVAYLRIMRYCFNEPIHINFYDGEMDGVTAGKNLRVGRFTNLCAEAFEFEWDDKWLRYPSLAGVVIGEDVHIGDNCSVSRGIMTDTVINDRVRIDNFVSIGHGAQIGKDSIIGAHSNIAPKVKIGCNVIVPPFSNITSDLNGV